MSAADPLRIGRQKKRTNALDSLITKEEWVRMLQSAEDARDQVILALGVLGLRASEIGQCKREWVDVLACTIALPSGATKRSKSRIVPFGKFRFVSSIVTAFFTLEKSVSLSRVAVYSRVQRLAKRAGIERPVTVHGLRATGATWCAQAGFSSSALREMFGWAEIATADHYLERSSAAAMRAMDSLGGSII